MLIRTRRTLVGDYGALAKNEVAEIPDDLARRLIRRRSVVAVTDQPAPAVATNKSGADAGTSAAGPLDVAINPSTSDDTHPLDHDADGRPGGSLPAAERNVCEELREEYERLTGSSADRRWGEARLRQEIKQAKGERDAPEA